MATKHYLSSVSSKETPQSEVIPGQEGRQVKNSAGGVSYAVDDWMRLQRFLILGSEGGSYYASEQKLTRENADVVLRCVKEDGIKTVKIIWDISVAGRAPKNDQAIFALALASVHGDEATRRYAYTVLPRVCRIGTHLFMFAEFREQFGGWGRGVRNAIADWYLEKDAGQLSYQLIKYQQRNGWSHRDLLALSHAYSNFEDPEAKNAWYQYAQKKGAIPLSTDIVGAFYEAQTATSPEETAALVEDFNLPREALNTDHLKSPVVWEAMLPRMPLTAMIRNLATMTRIDLLTSTSKATNIVIDKLSNTEHLHNSCVHPIQVLMAARTYSVGRGLRGSNTWSPVGRIVDALNDAFYAAFDNVEPTGKSRLIALDISGSMWGHDVAGIPGFTPAEAAGAMALLSMKTGDPYEVCAFTGGGRGWYGPAAPAEVIPGLSIHSFSARQRLDDVLRSMENLSQFMGQTDCALPMIYATAKQREFDVFEIYTDNETWFGNIHPSQALVQYRNSSGIDAKLIVVGMVANNFSIADPYDPGMLDVVGFDSSAPAIMSEFINGNV